MSDDQVNKKNNKEKPKEKTKEETKEEKRKRLKIKLRNQMEKKRVGKMNKTQKKKEIDKYCEQTGLTQEQIKDMEKAFRKTKK